MRKDAKRKVFYMLSAFKNFGVTFLIAAIIFGVIAYFAVGFVLNTVDSIMENEKGELESIIQNPDDGEGESESDGELVDPPEEEIVGESFNFLVITTDYRPDIYDDYKPSKSEIDKGNWDEADYEDTAGFLTHELRRKSASSIVLVRIDKENKQYIYSYISPKIRVYTSSGYRTLAEVWEYYGKQTLAEYVNALTGIKPKYTLLVNGYNLDELSSLLGNTTTSVSRDIYFDGMYYSMQYETSNVVVLPDGEEKITHIPNTYTLSKGDIAVNSDSIYTILSVKEHSVSDLKSKEAYTVDLLKKYLTVLGAMEEEDRKIMLAKLITRQADWGNIEGLGDTVIIDKPTESETEGETAETKPSDPTHPWSTPLGEPEDAIIETNYTMNAFDDITDLISAIDTFESVVVTYPCSYVAATAESDDYFEADYENALNLYAKYKVIPEANK
jgi:hypothetical protein